ncbi:transcription factor MYB108-like [Trifolium medium]|uniref:Transcription factor MYB108-like n=1 Tax=Trifolium medium TaxID=97028 RepID=A0A392NBJ1_9FABA|nr:transcription factor MYB108-like [Trifolium medium]
MRYLWMPRLVERIQAAASTSAATATTTNNNYGSPSVTTMVTANNPTYNHNNNFEVHTNMMLNPTILSNNNNNNLCGSQVTQSYTPDNSSNGAAASSDSFGTQVSPISDLTQDYYNVAVGSNNGNNNPNSDYYQQTQQFGFDCITSPSGLFPQMDYNSMEPNTPWIQGDTSDNFWNVENMLLFQQLNDNM